MGPRLIVKGALELTWWGMNAPKVREELKVVFNFRDVAQLLVGAAVLATPIAYSEEAWSLGEGLSFAHVSMLFLASFGFLAIFVYVLFYQSKFHENRGQFVSRVVVAYIVTFLVAAIILAAIDRFPLFSLPWVAIKRAVVVAFPGCFSATLVDAIR